MKSGFFLSIYAIGEPAKGNTKRRKNGEAKSRLQVS